MRPGCGDRQGDTTAAPRYVLAQYPLLQEWIEDTQGRHERRCLEVRDPLTGLWVCPSHMVFADDVARVGVCENGAQAARKLKRWRASLHEKMAEGGVGEGDAKLQHLVVLQPASVEEYAELRRQMSEANLQNAHQRGD